MGGTATTATVTLETAFDKTVSWSAREGAAWLALGTTEGTVRDGSPKRLTLTVQRSGLAAGDYTTNVSISSDRGGGTETVAVKMHVSGTSTTFAASPLQLDFGSTASTMSVILKNSGTRSLTWTAAEGVGWLALNATSGTIAAKSQKTVTVSVNRSGKRTGTYSTNIKFSAGTKGSATVTATMTVGSAPSGTVLLSGQLVNQFTGAAMPGVNVQFGGKSATTNSSGMFTISGSATNTLQQLTLTGSGIYKRVTFARTGDTKWGVVPSGFGMSAFNDIARDEFGSTTIRWVTPPTVYVDSRPEGFSSSALSTWISEVKVQAADFVSKWSGTVVRPAAVIVTSNPPNDFSPGTIVIHFSENSSDYGGSSAAIGYARLSYGSSGAINGSAVWLRYLQYADRPGKRMGILGHELGHAMGYGHMSTATPSFMEPSIGTKTDLLDFDRQAASFLYKRSPHNSTPDTDSSSSYFGSLTPSAVPAHKEWVCDAGDGLTTAQ